MKEKIKKGLKNKFLGLYEPSEDKTKSLVLLAGGIVFMIVLLVFIKTNYYVNNENNNYQQQSVKELSLKEIFDKYNNNYGYNITILDNDTNVYYIGKVENEVNIGKKVINDENIEYKITYEGVVNNTTNEVIDNLYDNYLYKFFNPSNLYEYLVYLTPEEKQDNDIKIYSYQSTYDEELLDIKLTTTIESIKEITYNYKGITYNIVLSL